MFIKKLDSVGRVIGPGIAHRLKSGLVVLSPGESVGLHTTASREEMIIVLEGEATVIVEGQVYLVAAGEVGYIGPELLHDVENRSPRPLRYLYVTAPLC